MSAPLPDGLPDDELQPWRDQLQKARTDAERQAAQEYYFDHILPKVIDRVRADPENASLQAEGYNTLISLMGFSPETTVIATAVVRPKKLVVVYGAPDDEEEKRKVEASYNLAAKYLLTNGLLTPAQMESHVIRPTDPVDIYEVIRKILSRTPTIDDNAVAIVDVTGGKKVMSATAGQAAWEGRVPLCYVEGRYDPIRRRPIPGTEWVLKLMNPSAQEQSQLRVNALLMYANRNFPEAVAAFEKSRANRVENRLDEFALDLCKVYVRWLDLDLPQLASAVGEASRRLGERRITSLFKDRRVTVGPIEQHLAALQKVADADPFGLIASFRELAALYGSDAFQRYDFACLMLYRGMEAVVEVGLKAHTGGVFEMGNPDYTLLGDPVELKKEFVALSKKVDKRREQEKELPSKVTFVNGLALLCLTSAAPHDAAAMTDAGFVGKYRQTAETRNRSILAHGKVTLTKKNFDEMAVEADELARAVLGAKADEVQALRDRLKLLDLTPLNDPNSR